MDKITQYSKLMTQRDTALADRDRLYNLWISNNDPDCYYQLSEVESEIQMLKSEMDKLEVSYDEEKNISSNSKLAYALTIGSAETEDHTPCLSLYKRFTTSALCSGTDILGYFEKGDNGYIHIHAIIYRNSKFKLSLNEIRKRYGSHNGKQHNFDLKRITGLEIPKWKNYIKKDNHLEWNSKVNPLIS